MTLVICVHGGGVLKWTSQFWAWNMATHSSGSHFAKFGKFAVLSWPFLITFWWGHFGFWCKRALKTQCGNCRFSVTHILSEMNFGEFCQMSNCSFCHFRGSNLCQFGKFQPSQVHKIQHSEPLNVWKWQILRLYKG